jgi:predicted oxidoreductase
MNSIYLSDSGPKVSPAIYGFYRWRAEDLKQSQMERVIDLCLGLGINSFDHADIYGGYHCEELFGKVLREKSVKRDDVVLFTKAGLSVPSYEKRDIRLKHRNSSPKHLLESLEQSLRNLRTDHVDIFLLNEFDAVANLDETALTLEKIRNSGKAKHIGVTNFTVFQHQLLSTYLKVPIVTNHIELNLLNTRAFDNGQIDYMKQRYTHPLATSPLAEGKIAESTDKIPLRIRGKLEEMADRYRVHFESIAIAWLVKLGALPIIGTLNEQRIRNISAAFDLDLDRQDWYELYNISKDEV